MITYPADAVNIVTDTALVPARLIGFGPETATVELDGRTTVVAAADVLCAQCGNWDSVLTCTRKQQSRFNHATTINA